jgi:acyl transferase domain-containing protein
MVVLKRLSHAVAEGDRVYAVIKGSAVGHDGRTTSVTAPSPIAQVYITEYKMEIDRDIS